MAANVNRIFLMGRLITEPIRKDISDSLVKTYFILGVKRKHFPSKGHELDLIPVCFWGKKGEVANEVLKKESCVMVEGRIEFRVFNKDNQTNQIVEVVGDNFEIL